METTQVKYVIRKQSDRAYTYGIGEVVTEGVTLFRLGNYNLDRDQIEAKIRQLMPKGK